MANFWGNPWDEIFWGTNSADSIWADGGDDFVDGKAGNDSILAGAGNDTVYGGHGRDWIEGGDDDDRLYAGTYDRVGGYLDRSYHDVVWGDDGNDVITIGGFDTAYGGDGADVILVDYGQIPVEGSAYIDGGADNDRIIGGRSGCRR